jgi:hypothetical protein
LGRRAVPAIPLYIGCFVPVGWGEAHLSQIHVKTNIETMVDNLDDFYSSVMQIYGKQTNLIKRQYVIQTYGLGLNKLVKEKRGGRESVVSVPLTASDKMTVKSVVLLPFPVVNYSRINMPETSILEKANLHFHPVFLFRLLRKSQIAPYIVDDLTKELSYADSDGAESADAVENHEKRHHEFQREQVSQQGNSDQCRAETRDAEHHVGREHNQRREDQDLWLQQVCDQHRAEYTR